MKIFICASKYCYDKIPPIKEKLEKNGHVITLPNSYEDPFYEERIKKDNPNQHLKLKERFFLDQIDKVKNNDALLIVNENKGEQENYIGGSVLLEMYDAWRLKKKIFMFNPAPNNMLKDEIIGLNPIIINKDISKIK